MLTVCLSTRGNSDGWRKSRCPNGDIRLGGDNSDGLSVALAAMSGVRWLIPDPIAGSYQARCKAHYKVYCLMWLAALRG